MVDDGTVDSWPPEAIRALRGEESRAALARQLGVTALTIYRWELPLSAPESRRPQKRLRERLQALGAERSGVRPRDIDDVPPSSEATRDLLGARVEKMAWQPGNQDAAASPVPGEVLGLASRIESFDPISAPPRSRSALDVGDRAALLPVFGDVAYAHWERAEEELVDLLAAGRLAVPGRALAQILMALVQLLGRNDVRGAFSTLLPILSAVASGELEGEIALRAHTVAALLFSTPTGQLFDAGRVRDHAARAARISTPHGCEDLCILAQIGQLRAALTLGDRALFSRHMVRHRASLAQAEQPVTRSLVSLLLAHSAYLDGYLGDAQERFSALAHETHALGFSTVEVEARGYVALLTLEAGGAAEVALELCEVASACASRARLEVGVHDILLAAVVAEALFRLGRREAAQERLGRGIEAADRLAWPPVMLLYGAARVGLTPDRFAGFQEALDRQASGPLSEAVSGARSFLAGLHAQGEGEARQAATAFGRAADALRSRGTRPWLTRYAHDLAYGNAVLAEDEEGARRALRRAERLSERLPAAWYTALRRWFRGVSLILQGRHDDASPGLRAALSVFAVAGDVPMTRLLRHGERIVTYLAGAGDGIETLRSAEDELLALGVLLPEALRAETLSGRTMPDAGRGAAKEEAVEASEASMVALGALTSSMARLTLRGLSPLSLLRELREIVTELTGAPVQIDEIDSDGRALPVLPGGESFGDAASTFEFGDGGGRRFQVGVGHELIPKVRILVQAVTPVASLALEVASLRMRGGGSGSLFPVEEDRVDVPGIIAAAPETKELLRDVSRLARSRATVLLRGESGTGKEIFARAVHEQSARASRACVTFNCASIPRDLFEGQLFGYRKGAFTGATSSSLGVIRAADGGTLFLDEIGDLPLDLQPKLLRFLENGEVLPLGETRPVRVDVRVVAATHRDLDEMMRAGRFREDLFYRLQVVTLSIPPLRDRRADILALARHFIRALTPKGETAPRLSQDALRSLLAHSWPGNVREVRNVIERALAFSPLPPTLTASLLRL